MLHTRRILVLVAIAASIAQSAFAAVETYKIDPAHSNVEFGIRHFFSKVTGKFAKFEGSLTIDRENLENSSVHATIDAGSIDTSNTKRDGHLKSPDFFEVAKYPSLTFKSKSWKKTGENTFDVTGDLTIKDVTKEVVLKVTALGFGPGMQGAMLSGWEATTTINRFDYNVSWGKGNPASPLGDTVEIRIGVEAILQK
jgi:polyisoprenoid-binding protein YceI